MRSACFVFILCLFFMTKEQSAKVRAATQMQNPVLNSDTSLIKEQVADYRRLHNVQFNQALFDELYFGKLENAHDLSETIKEAQASEEPLYKFNAKRAGKKEEHLEILIEVASIEELEMYGLGLYKTSVGDGVFLTMTSLVNTYLAGKAQEDEIGINILGSITGIADANPIGDDLVYKGELGAVTNVKFRNKSWGLNETQEMNIRIGASINNLELAFLRAYNVHVLLLNGLNYFSKIEEKDIEIIAIDDQVNEGYNWRKASVKLRIENFYLAEFNALPRNIQEVVVIDIANKQNK